MHFYTIILEVARIISDGVMVLPCLQTHAA